MAVTVPARGPAAPVLPSWVPIAGDRIDHAGRELTITRVVPTLMETMIVRLTLEAVGA